MHWQALLAVLLLTCFLTLEAQDLNCRRLKQRCDACIRRLNDTKNDMGILNNECRDRLRRSFLWRDRNRCDIQDIACRANNRRLNCRDIALLSGMRRLEGA